MKQHRTFLNHGAAALLAILVIALFAASSRTASAQCGPCRGDSYYRIKLTNWPVAMGFASVTVRRVNDGTGSVGDATHTGLLTGTYDYQYFPTNPTSLWHTTAITLVTNYGTIVDIPCQSDPQCFSLTKNSSTYCIQIKFTKEPGGSSAVPCTTIEIEKINCPCP